MVQTGLQVDQTSTNRERRASSKFKSRSTNQPCFDQASKTTKIQGPSDSRASESCTGPALRLCFCHHGDPETIQGLKWSPDRSSKRRFLKTKPVTFNVPKASHTLFHFLSTVTNRLGVTVPKVHSKQRKLINPSSYCSATVVHGPWSKCK